MWSMARRPSVFELVSMWRPIRPAAVACARSIGVLDCLMNSRCISSSESGPKLFSGSLGSAAIRTAGSKFVLAAYGQFYRLVIDLPGGQISACFELPVLSGPPFIRFRARAREGRQGSAGSWWRDRLSTLPGFSSKPIGRAFLVGRETQIVERSIHMSPKRDLSEYGRKRECPD